MAKVARDMLLLKLVYHISNYIEFAVVFHREL